MPISGRIIEEHKNYFLVSTPGGEVRASTRGVLKLRKTRVCAGDLVDIEMTNADPPEGLIAAIHERSTYLSRPPLANLSQVVLVYTLKAPPLDLEAADRFLVCSSAYGLTPVIVFNKIDLLSPDECSELQLLMDYFRRAGYQTLATSAVRETGIRELIEVCSGRISAFAGLSGVGKSALLRKIFPGRELRLGEVSGVTGRGTHTTTSVTLLPLPGGGFIADTPGLSFVDLPLVPEEDVASYFPELEQMIGKCKFNNCIHENEPGCKVREAVENGAIARWRVEHYLKIFKEMRERRREYRRG